MGRRSAGWALPANMIWTGIWGLLSNALIFSISLKIRLALLYVANRLANPIVRASGQPRFRLIQFSPDSLLFFFAPGLFHVCNLSSAFALAVPIPEDAIGDIINTFPVFFVGYA